MSTVSTNKQTSETPEKTATFSIEFTADYVFIDCDTWEDGKAFEKEAVLKLLGLASPEDIVNRLPEEASYDIIAKM